MANKVKAFILLGGFAPGPDGFLDSAGMELLKPMLSAIGVDSDIYPWSDYERAGADVRMMSPDTKVAVIGYSGGGWRAVSLANLPGKPRIDLMILYDPSPTWMLDKERIGANVKRAITYQNPIATMPSLLGMLGGGVLESAPGGPQIERVIQHDLHPVVQLDEALHARTVAECKKLMLAAPATSI
jgi:pimeloyl-ACP methyl ester carboxylesterase